MFNKRGVVAVVNGTTEIMDTVFEDICREVVDPMFEAKCTAGVDGNHSLSPESGHYYGRSKDYGFSGRHVISRVPIDISHEKRDLIALKCQRRFDSMWGNGEFVVILEVNHFHIQRKRGTV